MKLRNLLLIGALPFLFGCKTLPNITEYRILFTYPAGPFLVTEYDTDNDNIGDIRFFNLPIGVNDRGSIIWEHMATQEDKNRNHLYEENEFTYKHSLFDRLNFKEKENEITPLNNSKAL